VGPFENNKIGKISLAKVEAALASAGGNGSVNVPVTEVRWLSFQFFSCL
jgi:hypothetical protein